MDYNAMTWRQGTGLKRAVFAVVPTWDHDAHPFIGLMDSPELAFEVISAHNSGLNRTPFAVKEQLIKDLERALSIWPENGRNIEEALIVATGNNKIRMERAYKAFAEAVDILQEEEDATKPLRFAIDKIRGN